jgi:hypothetical protein
MITHWQSSETIVGHLRVEGGRIDPATAQLRLSTLLNNAVFHPTALPPAAIVFIRKLRDPLPRSLRIQQRDIRPPPAWQQALNATLDRLVASATRPAIGSVPANAEAVVFLDRSELLASLASDWCEGRVATRWWWQSLPRKGTASQIVKELWRSAPEYVPAALEHLAKANNVIRFVGTFSDAEVRSLFHAVGWSFGLHDLVSAFGLGQQSSKSSSLGSATANITLPTLKSSLGLHSTERTFPRAPWLAWVPEAEATELAPAQQSFLGIALMLQRAAAKVRAEGFVREVETWQREILISRALPFDHFVRDKKDESGGQRVSLHEATTVEAPENSTVSLNPGANSVGEFARESAPLVFSGSGLVHPDTTGAQASPVTLLVDGSTGELASSQDQLPPPQRRLRSSLEEKSLTSLLVEHRGTGAVLEKPIIKMEAATDARVQFPLIESQTATQFGGLFYLVNLALYLGLYGDFTTPEEPGIELSIWDFVALVGRELVGERIQDDPLWTLLARLSGRTEGEEPGGSFEPKDEWRLPAEWLEPFSKERLGRCWAGQGRLRLFHSAGFLMLDVPLTRGNPAEQLRRLLNAYEPLEFGVSDFELAEESGFEFGSVEDLALKETLETRNSKPPTESPLRLWLERLMPYLRVRVQRALGLDETEDPAPMLCEQQGRISVTATHVDLFFALAELPIEIRFAGLDRNPGWVPAAGRFITFHFE